MVIIPRRQVKLLNYSCLAKFEQSNINDNPSPDPPKGGFTIKLDNVIIYTREGFQNMGVINEKKEDLLRKMEQFLSLPQCDPQMDRIKEELNKELHSVISESEDLSRYRETEKRMNNSRRFYLSPPNFPYTIQTSV